ncbi:MAG TPA: hypothetical protein VF622_12800, partial [Segetibacter sp.]
MKKIILSILIVTNALVANAQQTIVRSAANYDAAHWKPWLLNNPKQINIPAPPTAAELKVELKTIKQRVANVDEKKMREIQYWNAGAPSYRWNQIIPGLVAQKQEVQLRMPASWMNIAIYDATILAWKEKLKYKTKRPTDLDPSLKAAINSPNTYSYPCEHSVTASAAANVLAYFFPEKKDSIFQIAHAASQSRIDAGVQFLSAVDAGWKLGEEVA